MKMNETDFVIKINEIYHDLENSEYEKKHEDIFSGEIKRWNKLFNEFVASKKNIKILDVGTGTGFVPLVIGGLLNKDDLFFCSDVSKRMLGVAEKNIKGQKFDCRFKFVKLNGKNFPFKTNYFDFITINSVVHHIPDYEIFFSELERILKKNGKLLIVHEPNKLFFKNMILWGNYLLLCCFFNQKRIASNILRVLGLLELLRKFLGLFSLKVKKENLLFRKINKELKKKCLIKTDLPSYRITRMVDFNSPTAGGYSFKKGIDVDFILKKYLQSFEKKHFETYHHIYDLSQKNRLLKKYDFFLKHRFPSKGAMLLAVIEKVR